MRSCRMISSCIAIAFLIGGLHAAHAQPSLAEHRYMVSEHTSVNQLAGLLTSPFQDVEIRNVLVPEEVTVGEPSAFSVGANVGTATLPITAEWTFPNGVTKRGLSTTHTFEAPGTYEVTVRVANRESSQEKTVTVTVVGAGRRS